MKLHEDDHEYTPGPWRCEDEWVFVDGKCLGEAMRIKDHSHGWSEAHANARLMSAAPELLQALQDILREHEKNPNQPIHGLYFSVAREAIAKAEGSAK